MAEVENTILLKMDVEDDGYRFTTSIDEALQQAEHEINILNETVDSLESIKPHCDKLDYLLAASSGAICGVMDIFLVGKPGESPLGDITDKWFENRVVDFANLVKGKEKDHIDSYKSAIQLLEKKFKIPYDQTGAGDAGKMVFDLTMSNHHFKSLAHNPSLLGLFFSILDQFNNESHFITDGELISLEKADDKFELRGKTVPAKFFCAFVNWFGHLISDVSGSKSSQGRGMGIPSPLWTWSNDIIAIKRKLNLDASEIDKSINDLALNLFSKGYDARFQTTQLIPVIINEMIVRLLYSIRRLIKYYSKTEKGSRSFNSLWESCEPFSNATVKRMLTVAHGTFCLIDASDATVRGFAKGGGAFNPLEFFLRLNIVGIGRFTISLYGEAKRGIAINKANTEIYRTNREKEIIEGYIDGLNTLYVLYNDSELLNFVNDLKRSDAITAFYKTVILAEKRNVPEEKIIKTKDDIDAYFLRRS